MADSLNLGARVKVLRRRAGLTQAQLAERLEISPSYVNLIEKNRRPLTVPLLLKIAREFKVDLESFAVDETEKLATDLMEVFADPLFEGHRIKSTDVRELAQTHTGVGRSVLTLYNALRTSRDSADNLAEQVADGMATEQAGLPSEEVSDFIQHHMNHFPALEDAAERLWADARLRSDRLYDGLVRYMEERLDVRVQVATVAAMEGSVRRYDPERRVLLMSEVLAPRSRMFQVAHQLGLLTCGDIFDELQQDEILTTEESRKVSRVALANYYAAALLMPYERILEAAETERYDIELLGHRFRTSFEQVCHRLTTLRRRGFEGIPFHFVRVDIAGNVSKRFSASGIRIARFSGLCPRWNIFRAFLTPGLINVQMSEANDDERYFCIARTVNHGRAGFHAQPTMHAVALGCHIDHAPKLVYGDGMDLRSDKLVVPIGTACRLCDRRDCEQRAFPALTTPLRIDENDRGLSFYAPAARPE